MIPAATHSRGARLPWIVVTAAVVVAAVLIIPSVYYLRETPVPSLPETRLEINTSPTADPTSFALSPDGSQIVFVASGDGAPRLWLRSLASTIAQPLAGTEGASFPFWSPDTRSVGFFADSKLKRFDIGGGAPQTLANAVVGRGGTWSPEGVILFSPSSSSSTQIFRIPASGGEAVPVTKVDTPSQQSHRFPQFLPGGRQFLFYVNGSADAKGIYLVVA